ncbi:MAG TPA: carbon-nitrogen hydrolase family protein [Verrucomicrobiales bacterium]|nr:carbon-nitrogen hydrolase family protein [Verrucomicrobiales bacterium]
MSVLRVAACEYPVEFLTSWHDWSGKLRRLCTSAVEAGASLLVFPEYAAMELASLLPEEMRADLTASLGGVQMFREAFLDAHRSLAAELGVTILAGSFPWETDGRFVNRAWLCTPDGRMRHQDKIIMTRFERELWGITGSRGLTVFEIPGARVGVLICYDSEFPLLARQLVENGADILLVPSCTDTEAGYHRVMLSCRARALEQQCFTVQSPTAGEAPWSPALDTNTGHAGFFGPVDTGFSSDGILASGAPAETTPWLIADLPLSRLASVRRRGQVKNFADWPEQEGVSVERAN